jgi:hypothetical protein
VVHAFSSKAIALEAFVQQGKALHLAEEYLADEAKAVTNIANNITLINVLTLVHMMFTDIYEQITEEVARQRAHAFLVTLQSNENAYDAVVHRAEQKFKAVLLKHATETDRALALSKIILSLVGLKQRSRRVSRANGQTQWVIEIANAREAEKFIQWRLRDDDVAIAFSSEKIEAEIVARANHMQIFQSMTDAQKAEVIRLLNTPGTASFQVAVEAVLAGMGQF